MPVMVLTQTGAFNTIITEQLRAERAEVLLQSLKANKVTRVVTPLLTAASASSRDMVLY
jgi:hypothetical protein